MKVLKSRGEVKVMKGKALGVVGAVSALIVLAVLVPTATAQPPAGPVHEIPFTPPITATIYVGEYVRIGTAADPVPAVTALTFQQRADPQHTFDIPVSAGTASMEISDDVVAGYTGLYDIFAAGVDVGDVSIVEPSLSITVRDDPLEAGGQEISSAVFEQTVWIYADTNLPPTAVVDIVRTDPEGFVYKTRTTIGALTAGVQVTISSPEWITGTHELKFEVVENLCWGISESECPCDPVLLTVRKAEITIEMPEHTTVGKRITITIKGPANVPFQCHVVAHADDVMVTSGEDNPYGLPLDYDGDGVPESEVAMSVPSIPNPPITFADGFSGVTDENGEYKFVVYFRDDRTYTFRVESDFDADPTKLNLEEWEEEDIAVLSAPIPVPCISITTDRTSYTTGDIMFVNITISNPAEESQNVIFNWWVTLPSHNFYTAPLASVPISLPADCDMTFSYPITVGYWGAEAFGAVFCVALTDQASGKILAFDAAFWNYEPSAMHKDGKNARSIVQEIKRALR